MATNTDGDAALCEMREKLALLKGKLKEEQIVNAELMRKAMKNKVRYISGTAWLSAGAAVMVMAIIPGVRRQMGLSASFEAATLLLMTACAFFSWFFHRGISPNMMNGNLKEVAKQLQGLRRNYRLWKRIGYPLGFAWALYFGYEVLNTTVLEHGVALSMVAGMAAGMAVGGIAGTLMQRKTETNIDDIIRQIEQLEEPER